MNSIKYFIISCFTVMLCQASSANADNWFLKAVNLPAEILTIPNKEKVVIAIIDDGMRVTHNDLKGFIWGNPNEIPDNGIDDDGNGLIDDVHGWDVADNNNTVLPPQARLRQFYHGTHLAGIITQITQASIVSAESHIRLMPVKTLSDGAPDSYLRDAYKGVEYAIDAGADIILTSWGVGTISAAESRILDKAKEKGILIIASAGNMPEEKKQYPAAYPSVIAVSALDKNNNKIKQSNFGQFVDLSAPGVDIYSASTISDTDYEYKTGTSFATAITAAAAALVKLQHPTFSVEQVKVCLKSTADNLNNIDPIYKGKLGAGKLNIAEAVNCPFFTGDASISSELVKPQGYLHLSSKENKIKSWVIKPQGDFKGLRFNASEITGKVGGSVLKFFSSKASDSKLIASYPLSNLPESIYIPYSSTFVSLGVENSSLVFDGVLQYEAETINFTKQYCKETTYLNVGGEIVDGSGSNNYSFHSSCKWLITAPEGKVIKINFTEMDTEGKVDLIYFFNGAGTHKKIMAIFSGSKIPPELTTWRNQVLIWFVSDEKQQGQGWKLHYTFHDR